MNRPFSEILNQQDRYEIPDDWLQGRTAFGGILSAIIFKELLTNAPNDRLPLSLNIQFIAPAPPGEFRIETSKTREGKYLSQLKASMYQGDNIIVEAQAAFGSERPSRFNIPATSPKLSCSQSDAIPLADYDSPHLPTFIQHFENLYTESGFPFTGDGEGNTGGFCRHRSPATGYPALLALLDAWPPTILPMYKHPPMASSVHWHIQFHGGDLHHQNFHQEFFEYRATTIHSAHGRLTIDAALGDGNEVLATGRQLIAIFD